MKNNKKICRVSILTLSILGGVSFAQALPDFPRDQSIVYEMQLGSFVGDCSYGGDSFSKIESKIPYLKRLGINTVQILPVTGANSYSGGQFTACDWGYNPTNFSKVDSRFAKTNTTDPNASLKNMIDIFHRNGIKVVLDVVYNHTHGIKNYYDYTQYGFLMIAPMLM